MDPRPLLSLLPRAIREKVFYRFLNRRQHCFRELYREARLALAPSYTMHNLVVGDVISGQIVLNGYYEYALSRKILQHAATGGLMVDVGANLGYFSLLWLHAKPDNRVVAIEAAPRNLESLRVNFERNRVGERVRVIGAAAGDAQGTVRFQLGPEEQTGWGGVAADVGGADTIEVKMVRLDEQITEPVRVLKIDVEGFDTHVIRGCEVLLRAKRIETIYFEQNPVRMQQLGVEEGEAQTVLQDHGYRCEPMDKARSQWMATRPGVRK